MNRGLHWITAAGLAMFGLFLGYARGAEVTRRDGSTVRGEILSEDDQGVVVRVSRAGITSKVTIARDEIASIDRTASTPTPSNTATGGSGGTAALAGEPVAPPVVKHAKPVYYRVPLRGTVGTTLSAATLDKALEDAAKRAPAAVILEMDSPGGLIHEVDKLVEVLSKHKKNLRIVVWVHQAISAAAITSLAVDEIYMQKGSTFGAATAFRVTPIGTPANINEKMQSIWRARGRSAAELGNHSPLLGEAMIDGTLPLYVRRVNGKAEISTSEQTGSIVLKERGKLLTLTGQEAVGCGLARGIADSHAELGRLMGFAGWTECEGVGVALAEWWEKRVEKGEKEWKAAIKRLDEAMSQAATNDPSNFRDYTQDMEGVRKWNARSTRCAESLKGAEGNLTLMMRLANEYPHLAASSERIESTRRTIAEIRARIEAGRIRVPVR